MNRMIQDTVDIVGLIVLYYIDVVMLYTADISVVCFSWLGVYKVYDHLSKHNVFNGYY